jgi:hypothetical protein
MVEYVIFPKPPQGLLSLPDRANPGAPNPQIHYFDIQRHWTRRIVPHLADPEFNRVLVRDFNRYTFGRWGELFKPGMYPDEFESCDWRLSHRGKQPRFWRYVKHAACHWLVNPALRLAMLVEPKRPWRIVTSDRHSTVWDGEHTLFDLQFLALGVDADECWQLASQNGTVKQVGKYIRAYMAEHYSREQERELTVLPGREVAAPPLLSAQPTLVE